MKGGNTGNSLVTVGPHNAPGKHRALKGLLTEEVFMLEGIRLAFSRFLKNLEKTLTVLRRVMKDLLKSERRTGWVLYVVFSSVC